MLQTAAGLVFRLAPSLKRNLWRSWYQDLARRFDFGDWVFMNYGFAAAGSAARPRHLDPEDEQDRYCIQLYDHVLGDTDLRELDVLEVGCGRGGGASFISRYRRPRSMTGVDLSSANIAFCRRRHTLAELRFMPGDAESLPFADNAFDAVVNVESSHCYPSMARFLAEVRRVLRPNGYFFFADLRGTGDVATLRQELEASGLTWQREESITWNVLEALRLDSQRKRALIRERLPWLWRGVLRAFAGIQGTSIYESFRLRHAEYLCCVLRKASAPV